MAIAVDAAQAGLVGSEGEVTLRYEQDPWEWLQPIVAGFPVGRIMEATGYSRRMVYIAQCGERRPSPGLMDGPRSVTVP